VNAQQGLAVHEVELLCGLVENPQEQATPDFSHFLLMTHLVFPVLRFHRAEQAQIRSFHGT
jgi:hypothetical protein